MNSRLIAYEILQDVVLKDGYSDHKLNLMRSNSNIKDVDKKYITFITLGTIQHKLYLEYVIDKFVNNDTPIKIKLLLWLALFEIKYADKIPNYASVSQYVDIAKKINIKFSGLVNAVLNKVCKNLEALFDIKQNDQSKVNIKYSINKKLFEMLCEQFSFDVALEVAKDSLNNPQICLRVNSLKISRDSLLEKYGKKYSLKADELNLDGIIADKNIIQTELFELGFVIAQDKSSIQVARILDPHSNDRVLDMCCAPGGKLTHISALMNNEGNIDAYEISKLKSKYILENIERLGCKNIKLNIDDATKISGKAYNKILLDAPCSGFGVIKRKPEIKLRDFSLEKLRILCELQKKLLESAYKNLEDGGTLVYSTCTMNKMENDDQIKNFLWLHKDMKLIFEQQLLGYENNSDGFYIAKMIKKTTN